MESTVTLQLVGAGSLFGSTDGRGTSQEDFKRSVEESPLH
jgi:hypothetical protein